VRHTLIALFVAAAAVSTGVSADTQRIYLTVVDGAGRPVTNLKAEDFAVRLDTAAQEVLKVELALEPASVLILTDRLGLNTNYPAFDVGQTLRTFANTIRKSIPDSRFALTTFDGTTLALTRFTSPWTETERALGRLMSNVDDAVLYDGISVAAEHLRAAPTDRKILFILLAAYRPDQSVLRPEVVGDLMRRSGASLWVVEARNAQGGNYSNPAREQVLDACAALSGGLRDVVASRSGVTTATRRVADFIRAQYVLTYAPGGGHSRTELHVEVKRPGVRVLAPGWIAR
jgi:hypothetical protein